MHHIILPRYYSMIGTDRAIGAESRTGIQHLNWYSAESNPPAVLSRHDPFGKVQFSPAQHLLSFEPHPKGPAHVMSGNPQARKERARRRRQRSPRQCSSPSLIYGCTRHLASFLPSCTVQIATLAYSTWKSQTTVYNCIKEQGRNAKQYYRYGTYRTTARASLSPLSLCTVSAPRLDIHSNEIRSSSLS